MNNFYKKVSAMLVMLCFLSIPFEALAGMRDKTLSDVMNEIMLTKNAAWLKANLGEPDEVDTKYPGYVVWRWKTKNKVNSKSVACSQVFALNASDQRLVGWHTDCNRKEGSSRLYGETDESTPIPDPVIPAKIAEVQKQNRMKAEAKAEAERTRKGNFADWLSTFVGTTEEDIVSRHPKLVATERLGNGKLIKSYIRDMNFDYERVDCRYSFSFLKGKVVGYSVGSCGIAGPRYFSATVPYKKPPAPASAL